MMLTPTTSMNRIASAMGALWRVSRPLVAVGLLMAAAAVVSAAALMLDPRTIGGAPAWLKPLKFAISTSVYSLTLAWVFTYLPEWRKTRLLVGGVTAFIFLMEVGIIDLQAWRGTASHFNVRTPLDAVLFGVMGVGIAIQTVASLFAAIALWRQSFADRVMGWALRLGMTVTLTGAAAGGLMVRPTEAQLAEARATHHLEAAGAHTVGAPDGGPGLPGTGWSLEHGDLRVPHFIGLHALQALAIAGVLIRRRRFGVQRAVRLMKIAAASYAALFAVLMWQALHGEPFARPAAVTQALLVAWLASTGVAIWAAGTREVPRRQTAVILG